MNKYFKYLSYLFRHKWYVGVELFKKKLYWQAFSHDMSKFLPSEFFPYVNKFGKGIKEGRDKTGYYDPTKGDFKFAWFKHQKRNKHHWQYWVMPKDGGKGNVIFEIPNKYVIEMIADWTGASKAQGSKSTVKEWYLANKDKLVLHPTARWTIELSVLGMCGVERASKY
jgi:hypothetical protein